MQLVAATKLAKAQNNLEENSLPLEMINKIVNEVWQGASQIAKKNAQFTTLILITSEKGLCGGFNSSISRVFKSQIALLEKQEQPFEAILVGRKGREFIKNLEQSSFYSNLDELYTDLVEVLADKIFDNLQNKGGQVCIYFNEYQNTITYNSIAKNLWPIKYSKNTKASEIESVDYSEIVKIYFKVNILNALLSANTSELSARMIAMDNATRNAKTLIDDLQLNLNRKRQAIVTKELIEIISGAEAL